MKLHATRALTTVEMAIGLSLLASVTIVGIASCRREWSSSKQIEATSGVLRLGEEAVRFATGRPPQAALPISVDWTPNEVPRGFRVLDAEGTWAHPTWRAFDFRASPEGVPHAYVFSFETVPTRTDTSFSAKARGDLDGDGQESLFEMHGQATISGAVLDPALRVKDALE
ncbi:MAG: hypothetical protein KBF88_09905 [Polyangiaceae bacterium]|nr:hypothetical protein [Polyangiaceae bacterium]